MDADTPKEPPTSKPEDHELADRDLESVTGVAALSKYPTHATLMKSLRGCSRDIPATETAPAAGVSAHMVWLSDKVKRQKRPFDRHFST